MPHIVIEYSTTGHAALDIDGLMLAVHRAAAGTGVMRAADIKVRATPFDDFLVAGERDGFVHASVYLLEGRSPAEKAAVSESLRAAMVGLLGATKSISVDIRDMDARAYRKRLPE